MHKRERHVKLFGTILCEVFAFLTIIYLLADGEADRLALAFGTLLLALLPMLLEKLFRCRICLPVYLFALAGTVGFFFCRLISQWPLKPDKGWFRSFVIGRIGKIYEKLNIHKWQATIPDVTKYTARSAMLNMEEKKDHDFLISVTGQVSNAAVRQ